jgi:hypothetical protein
VGGGSTAGASHPDSAGWDQALIAEGVALLSEVLPGRAVGE